MINTDNLATHFNLFGHIYTHVGMGEAYGPKETVGRDQN